MRLSDIKGDEALDVLAELIEPLTEIMSDEKIIEVFRDKKSKKTMAIKYAIERHKKSVMFILATLERKNLQEYECNLLTLPKQILDIVNDPIMREAFISQGQEKPEIPFGSATVNTGEKEN